MNEPQAPQATVSQLKQLWKRSEHIVNGGSSLRIDQMPSWEMICCLLSWEHHLVEGGYFSAKSHGFYGVYRLVALSAEGDVSRPATLSRVCGEDSSGTLYIGEATDLSRRLNQLRRSAGQRRERSHGAIAMLRRITRLEYPPERLGLALLFTGANTRGIERDLLLAYMNTFGDTPPLNYKLHL